MKNTDTNSNKKDVTKAEGGPQVHKNGDSPKELEDRIKTGEQTRELLISIPRCDSDRSIRSDRSTLSQRGKKNLARSKKSVLDLARESNRASRRALHNTRRGLPSMEIEGDTAADDETEMNTVSMTSEGENTTTEEPGTTGIFRAEDFPALPGTEHAVQQKETELVVDNPSVLTGVIEAEKRGRPPKGPVKNEERKAAEKIKAVEKEKQKELEILSPMFKLIEGKSFKNFQKMIQSKREEFSDKSSLYIETEMAECTEVIYKVAVGSGNLKGEYQSYLQASAAAMGAAVTELAIRANQKDGKRDSELAEIKIRLANLEIEYNRLKRENEELKKRKVRYRKEEPTTCWGNVPWRITSDTPLPSPEEGTSDEGWKKNRPRSPRKGKERTPHPPRDGKVLRGQEGVSLPPKDGETPERKGNREMGDSLPPARGGESSIYRGKEKESEEERMEVEIEMATPSMTFNDKDFSALEQKKKRKGKNTHPILEENVVRTYDPQPLQATKKGALDRSMEGLFTLLESLQSEVKSMRESSVPKIEGIIERILDKRLGDTHEELKYKKGSSVGNIPQKSVRQEAAPVVTGKGKGIKVTKITTLNPPANMGKSAATTANKKKKGNQQQQSPKQTNAVVRQTAPVATVARDPSENEQWTTVVKRKKKEGDTKKVEEEKTRQATNKGQGQLNRPQAGQEAKMKSVKRKEPRTAAIMITCPEGKYAEILREARAKIEPRDLGIERIEMRRSITGAMV